MSLETFTFSVMYLLDLLFSPSQLKDAMARPPVFPNSAYLRLACSRFTVGKIDVQTKRAFTGNTGHPICCLQRCIFNGTISLLD